MMRSIGHPVRSLKLAATLSTLALLAACAGQPIGRPFDGSKAELLKPGVSTRADAVAALGPPLYERVSSRKKDMKGQAIQPPQVTRILHYHHAEPSRSGAIPWVLTAREVNVLMIDDRVVGYHRRSTYKEDSTDLDVLRASELKAGQSTQADVQKKLGPPPGVNVWPLTLIEGGQTWIYGVDLDNKATHVMTRKRVYVHLNAQGVVEDLQVENKDGDSVVAPPPRGGGGGSTYTPVYVPPVSAGSMRMR
jgi:hypothetical protein